MARTPPKPAARLSKKRRVEDPGEGLSGPFSYYRPKDKRPVTLNITTQARELLDTLCNGHRVSRADVVERLLREHSANIVFGDRA